MKNNIDQVINHKRMTQGDLADMVGVRREYINRIINRRIIPSVYLGMRIADALKVPMEKLFVLED